ncbi:hypothetical protein J3B02_001677 [Coemansia erecta]|uniref:CST complex subunit STN1 n=1 Tax=Coemansia asiatica TaxID=1052880 RepID=A0A9W7XPT2_9FUNG|nr:hypothetical protein LPJ64_000778 [Coemansia asiatica]KAJ2856300.1 hypothetical protein J3B02_001677 [Coemansia erecta]KAJ2888159.1 hypothetical protein FB639_000831 [Coemansia asiatica]
MNLENRPCTRPQTEWGLDPLFWVPAKLFNGDLTRLVSAEPLSSTVFYIGNQHVIKAVELVGIVVSVERRALKMIYYQIDDGTGVISCVHFTTPTEQAEPDTLECYRIGDSVCVRGRLAVYRGQLEVIIRECEIVDPNQESLAWIERLSIRKFLASSPFATSTQ